MDVDKLQSPERTKAVEMGHAFKVTEQKGYFHGLAFKAAVLDEQSGGICLNLEQAGLDAHALALRSLLRAKVGLRVGVAEQLGFACF